MKYFAYGSNMLTDRLAVRVRASSPIPYALCGHRLRFHKRSIDGSGKCSLVETGDGADVVHGVIYDVPDAETGRLDAIEGVGHGYRRVCIVLAGDAPVSEVETYRALAEVIDEALVPYAWYRDLVLAGAEEHGLPPDYRAGLAAVPFAEDPDPGRATRREALEVLRRYRERVRRCGSGEGEGFDAFGAGTG